MAPPKSSDDAAAVEKTEDRLIEKKKKKKSGPPPPVVIPPPSFGQLLRECLTLLNLGVVSHDNRTIARVLRRVSTLRHLFEPEVYEEFVQTLLLPSCPNRAELLLEKLRGVHPPKSVDSKMKDTDMTDVVEDGNASMELVDLPSVIGTAKEFENSIGDVDLFLTTLGLMLLIDTRQTEKALPLATSVVETLSIYPPPYKYDGLLVGKAIFYTARVYELEGQFPSLKGFLMEVYRTSVLHRRTTPQAIALNLLLRNFLQEKLYDQAVIFLEKAPYPEGLRSNAQHARYLYYLSRINAVRLDYGEAYSRVTQAIRKAPQDGAPFGKGFRLAAHKLCFVVQLLMGEIPDRQLFNQKDLRVELLPYAKIVQAVRSGGLASFKRVMEQHEQVFVKDGNIDLVQRLHHNVIRVGLRKINASYSVISLDDVAAKLGLDSADDTECIVSKAISDGVIGATIDFASRTVQSKAQSEIQISDEPRKAFHGRIAFCLQLYNEAIKAMQYPETEGETKIEEAEARRKEHQEQLARAEKDEFDGGDDGDLI